MATNVNAQICVRRDTAANWTSANPTLLNGEVGYDTTNNKIKIGNGSSTWTALPYLTDATGGGGSGWPDTSKALWQCEFTGAVPNFTNTPTTAAFAPGPDYYWRTANSASGAVEAWGSPTPGHFGMVDLANLEFGATQNWIVVGNNPPSNWATASIGGNPGAALAENTHEFVTIWKPFDLLLITTGTWQVFAGCSTNNPTYPLDNTGASNKAVCFLFVASNASPNWICRARFYGPRPAELPVDYDYNTGIAHGDIWYNMKIVSVPGSGAAPYPTIQYYLNGTLVHSFNVNTVPGGAGGSPSQVASNPFFTVAGSYVGTDAVNPRMITSKVDYQHSYSTLDNANRQVPSIPA